MTGTPPPVDADPAGARGDGRWLWLWDVYLAVCLVAVALLVLRGHDEAAGPAERGVALTCLALIAAGWLLVGRRAALADDDTGPAFWLLGGCGVLFVGAVAAAGLSSYALFGLCAMAFLCLSLRPALVAVAVFNVSPFAVNAAAGASGEQLRDSAGVAILGVACAALLGTYIDRIARQSDDRARLIAELEASRAEVAALSHEAGVAAERARLAAEIHDTLAQGFTSIVTLVQAAESEVDTDRAAADRHLALAVSTARDNLAEARAMVVALGPAALRGGTLGDAVRRQAERLAQETGVTATSMVDLPVALPTALEVVILRAVQESLANVRKHASASTVHIGLQASGTGVTLTVRDDGTGFDPADQRAGYGLAGMRARAAQVAGELTVRSTPGHGTTVRLELPT